jgi:pantoate kinase
MSEDKLIAKVLSSAAFAPSHITGFFKIYPNGSTGAGLNTNAGATTRILYEPQASKKQLVITINNKATQTPVSDKVVASFDPYFESGALSIEHQLEYPPGYGMGMSGAGAFSLALALNDILAANLTYDECMEIAAAAEIASGTGLGDVIAQKYHGVMIGLPPYPSREVEIIPSEQTFVACGFFEPLKTESIIRSEKWKDRINEVGEECMHELSKERTISKFIALSRHFSLETKLASSQVKRVMKDLPGSTMAMLGQTVFILAETEEEAQEALSHHCKDIHVSQLAKTGARLLVDSGEADV